MPRDPNIPDEFAVFTLVLLRRPPNAPQMSDEEFDALQARHLAYRTDLHRHVLHHQAVVRPANLILA